PVLFEIFKYKIPEAFEVAIVRISIVGLCKIPHECFQIRVRCDHESCNRYFDLPQLTCKRERLVEDLAIETKTVLIIFDAFFDTRWLSIRDHEDLFVRILSSPENIHR